MNKETSVSNKRTNEPSKETYEPVEIEVIEFETEDVLTTSSDNETPDLS